MSIVAAQNTAADYTPHCPPPAEIGRVLYAAGDPVEKRDLRSYGLVAVAGACLGAVVGLVGIFVVGGLYEHWRGRMEHGADWFLASLLGGTLLGALLAFAIARRPTPRTSRFVGERGCAVVGKRVELLRFSDLRSMTARPLAMGPLSLRAIYVTDRSGNERRWHLSVDPAQAPADAPGVAFGEAALAAFSAFQSKSGTATT